MQCFGDGLRAVGAGRERVGGGLGLRELLGAVGDARGQVAGDERFLAEPFDVDADGVGDALGLAAQHQRQPARQVDRAVAQGLDRGGGLHQLGPQGASEQPEREHAETGGERGGERRLAREAEAAGDGPAEAERAGQRDPTDDRGRRVHHAASPLHRPVRVFP
ncbi:MAG: hypothetical protein U1E73_10830 [Planctomycetota bacterium]